METTGFEGQQGSVASSLEETEAEDRAFLAKQLELYSNAIVGFTVAQSLAYSYYFGTNCAFNQTVKTATLLAELLTGALLVSATLGAVGVAYLGLQLRRLFPAHGGLLLRVCVAKLVAVVFFGGLPVFLTLFYAVLDPQPNAACSPTAGPIP